MTKKVHWKDKILPPDPEQYARFMKNLNKPIGCNTSHHYKETSSGAVCMYCNENKDKLEINLSEIKDIIEEHTEQLFVNIAKKYKLKSGDIDLVDLLIVNFHNNQIEDVIKRYIKNNK